MKKGDILYKYIGFGRMNRYQISSIKKNDIEVKCLSCSGHNSCNVHLKKEKGNIVFSKMLNNLTEKYWHICDNKTEYYQKSKEDLEKLLTIKGK